MIPVEKPFIQTIDQPVSTPHLPDQVSKNSPTLSKKTKPILFILFGLIAILLLLLFLSLFLKTPPLGDNEKNSVTTSEPQKPSPSPPAGLEKEIEDIRKLIQDQQVLPLPKIDPNISL